MVRRMITSSSNAQIKNIIALQKKSKIRNEQDVFVVEGIKMFSELPKDRIVSVFVSESFLEVPEQIALLEGVKFESVSDKVFKEISDTFTPQGILAVVKQYHYSFEDLRSNAKGAPMFIVLEELQDPGNLGTILRTGEGAGVTGIILSKGCVDIYNSKVIRSTMGTVFRVPFMYTEDLPGTINKIKESCTVYAAYLKGSRYAYDECDYTKGTAFVIGNEAKGLTEEIAGLADERIIIPMQGQVESLNAAVAASILMYEGYRQRRQ